MHWHDIQVLILLNSAANILCYVAQVLGVWAALLTQSRKFYTLEWD